MLRQVPVDADLRKNWNSLVQQMECQEVFYTYEWALAAERAFGATLQPCLFLAYDDDSLVGVVALAMESSESVVFLGGTTSDYCDFVSAPPRRPEFVHAVLEELRKLDCRKLTLVNLPAESASVPALEKAREEGYFTFARKGYECAQVSLSTEERRENTTQSAGRRVQRFQKALSHHGDAEIIHRRSGEEISRALPEFATAHVARFLSTGRLSNLLRAKRRDFLMELTSLLSASGTVVLSHLNFSGRPIAWNFGFQFSGSWFWYQPTFDTEFKEYSPGVWLLSAMVAESCETSEISRIDMGLGAEGYKDRLANCSRRTLHFTLSTSSITHARTILRHKVGAVLKSMPPAEKLTRFLMSGASSARRMGKTKSGPWWWRKSTDSLPRRIDCLEWVPDRASITIDSESPDSRIQAIDLRLLANAAMLYEDDAETLQYLLHAAKLCAEDASGFAFLNQRGEAELFCWAKDFDIAATHANDLSNSKCTLITDVWTPPSATGKSQLREFLCRLADSLHEKKNTVLLSLTQPWLHRGFEDLTEMAGTGFVRRRSLSSKYLSPAHRSKTKVSSKLFVVEQNETSAA